MYLQHRGMTHLRGMPVCGISKRSVSEKDPCETSRFISRASKKKTQEKHEWSYFFHDGCFYDVETSQLICSANQWITFYILGGFVMIELIVRIALISLWLKL